MNWAWIGLGILTGWAWLAAAVVVAVQFGQLLKRRTGGSPAPGDGHHPVPGTRTGHPQAADPPPRPSPAPGFTPTELDHLTHIDQWAPKVDPVRRHSAQVLADLFREHFPHLADDDLGRLVLNVSILAREYHLQGTLGRLPGTLALAAGELTRLTRTEVHLDQR